MAERKPATQPEATQPEASIVDVPEKATPLEPGQPTRVPMSNGSTFAERKAVRLAAESKAITQSENK